MPSHVSSRGASAAVLVGAAFLAACQGTPPPAGSAWYRGTASVDPSAVSVFGPGGDVAIEWQQDPVRGLWLWREYRSGGWHLDTVWEVSPDLAQGQFRAGDSSGSWKGIVTLEDWQGTGIWMPAGWRYRLSLTDGSGTLIGTGNTSGGGYDDPAAGGNDPSDMLMIWIDQEWIRPDGTSAGRLRQTLNQVDAEEFRSAARRLGGNP